MIKKLIEKIKSRYEYIRYGNSRNENIQRDPHTKLVVPEGYLLMPSDKELEKRYSPYLKNKELQAVRNWSPYKNNNCSCYIYKIKEGKN